MLGASLKFLLPATGCFVYHFFDVHYAIRVVQLINKFKLREGKPYLTLQEPSILKRRVGLRDLDIYFHKNNARYLWNLDFSRVFLLYELGIEKSVF